MISISLSKGLVAITDDEDADLARLKWHAGVSTGDLYYAKRNSSQLNGKRSTLFLHLVILERMIGRPLKEDEYGDHINLNSLDNTRSNLRVVNNSLNQHNRHRYSNNTSGYKGVSFRKDISKWRARIAFNDKAITIGVYATAEEAYKAYCDKAIELLGDKARLV